MLTFLLLAFYALLLFLFVSPISQFLFFVGGLILGMGFLLLDRLILAKWYLEVEEQAQPIKKFISSSILFLLAFVGLAVYLITSGGNRFAQGIVMGLGLSVLAQMLGLMKNPQIFKQQFLWQLNMDIEDQVVVKIVFAFIGFLLFLTAKII